MSATRSSPNLNGPLKCFNAAENKKLGFHNSRSIVVSPQVGATKFLSVAAFSEWAKEDQDSPVLVSFGKYSMQYNFASGHNRGTEILQNMLTIAHNDPSTGNSIVNSEGLEPRGAIFTVENFANTQKTLQVEACETVTGDTTFPSQIFVGVSLDQTMPPCNQFSISTTTQATTVGLTFTTTDQITSSTASNPSTTSTSTCLNTSSLEVKFWWGSAYVVRSCDFLREYPNFCEREETSDPGISRFVYDVCEQECSAWTGCHVSETAEPVIKPAQPACPDTSNNEIFVWIHGQGTVRKTCAWIEENVGYCRRREMSGDPSRFYVYQYCDLECSDWVWCE